jgi:hypothetical protein
MIKKRTLNRILILMLSTILIVIVSVQLYANFYLKNKIISIIDSKIDGNSKIIFTTTDLYKTINLSGLNIFKEKKIGLSIGKCKIKVSPCIIGNVGQYLGKTSYNLKASNIYLSYKEILKIIKPLINSTDSKNRFKIISLVDGINLNRFIINFGIFYKIPLILENIYFNYSNINNKINIALNCDKISLFKGVVDFLLSGDSDSVNGTLSIKNITEFKEIKISEDLSIKLRGNLSLKSDFQLSPSQMILDDSNSFDFSSFLNIDKLLIVIKKRKNILSNFLISKGKIFLNNDKIMTLHIEHSLGKMDGTINFNNLNNITSEISIDSPTLSSGTFSLIYEKNNQLLKIIKGNFKNKKEKISINGEISFKNRNYHLKIKSNNNKFSNLISFLSKYYGVKLKVEKIISSNLEINGDFDGKIIPSGDIILSGITFNNNKIKKASLKFDLTDNILKIISSKLIFKDGNKCSIDGKIDLSKNKSSHINIKNFKITDNNFKKYNFQLIGSGLLSGILSFQNKEWNFKGEMNSSKLSFLNKKIWEKVKLVIGGEIEKRKIKLKKIDIKNGKNLIKISLVSSKINISGRIIDKKILEFLNLKKYFITNFDYSNIDFSVSSRKSLNSLSAIFTINSPNFKFLSIPFKISNLKIKFHNSTINIEDFKLISGSSSIFSNLSFNLKNKKLNLSFVICNILYIVIIKLYYNFIYSCLKLRTFKKKSYNYSCHIV